MMLRQERPSGSPHGHVLFRWCGPSGTMGMSSGGNDWRHLLLVRQCDGGGWQALSCL